MEIDFNESDLLKEVLNFKIASRKYLEEKYGFKRLDYTIENINAELESIIEELGNTRNRVILTSLNKYPILAVKAHTRPFDRRWMNITSAIIVPAGIFFYIRMWRFRLRLYNDLRTITTCNNEIIAEIEAHGGWVLRIENNNNQ